MIPFREGRGMIATASGYFDLNNPRPCDVDLRDIAVALSRINRFTGHGRGVVSVARHSVNCYIEAVLRGLPAEHSRLALMHDAAEAYVGDVSRPLKALLPDFKRIEVQVWGAIRARFDLPDELPPIIKEIDNLACITEAAVLLPDHEPWPGFPPPGFSQPLAHKVITKSRGCDVAMFLTCAEKAGIR